MRRVHRNREPGGGRLLSSACGLGVRVPQRLYTLRRRVPLRAGRRGGHQYGANPREGACRRGGTAHHKVGPPLPRRRHGRGLRQRRREGRPRKDLHAQAARDLIIGHELIISILKC